jgi:hypothetical protein
MMDAKTIIRAGVGVALLGGLGYGMYLILTMAADQPSPKKKKK